MLYYLNALFAIICCHNCGECVQNVNILDEAVQQLNNNHCLQPVLFRFNDMFWIKTDNSALAVPDVSCIADAFDYLFRFFFGLLMWSTLMNCDSCLVFLKIYFD